jgi:hypothetical protein
MPDINLLNASLFFSFIAYPVYAYCITQDDARPTRPTWLMILVTDLLLFLFMLKEGRFDWLTLGFTAGNVMMLVLMGIADIRAAKREGLSGKGRKRTLAKLAILGRDAWTSKDKASVVVALGAVSLWAVTGSPIISLCFSLVGKTVASIPMWINLYKEPDRESIMPWVLWAIGGSLYLASIPQAEYRFASLATPILLLVLEAVVIALLLRRYGDTTEIAENQKLAA